MSTAKIRAYVFWHRRQQAIPRELYEEKLIKFHEALDESRLLGFKGAVVARMGEAPWFAGNSEAYEEWYLLNGSEILDEFNETAVSGARKEPHDELARLARDFRAGLYELKLGPYTTVFGSTVTWLSKPKGMTYQNFYGSFRERLTPIDGSLWRRQMVLGPTTEFCVTSAKKLDLPDQFNHTTISRNIIWHSKRLAENNT